MSGTTEAFGRVKIDALPDGTQADYVLCDRQGRPIAALEAKRAGSRVSMRKTTSNVGFTTRRVCLDLSTVAIDRMIVDLVKTRSAKSIEPCRRTGAGRKCSSGFFRSVRTPS